jgi:hypothetical protein
MRQLALLFVLALAGCARKLPGPAECRAFALASLRLPPEVPDDVLAQNPRLHARAEELTSTCLTTPWDYALLDCLQSGRSELVCAAGFKQRRSLGAGVQ